MKCPRCGSLDITVTTIGGIGLQDPTRDPNKATCGSCGHRGNAGDWNAIEQDRIDAARWRALRPFLCVTMDLEGGPTRWVELKCVPFRSGGTVDEIVNKLVRIAQEKQP